MTVTSGRIIRLSLVLALTLVLAGIAHAQTTLVSDPTTLTFEPSADHDALLGDGRPAVDHYAFNVYVVGESVPFQSTDIGKPAPAPDGLIYYQFSGDVPSWPLPGGTYEARVVAVGPSGSGLSDASNPFAFGSSCGYALSGSSALVPAVGGGTSVGVTTATGCAWTAASDASWVVLSAPGGTGSGLVIATIAANTMTSSRIATLAVAGNSFTVTQEGAPCTFTLSASSASFAAAGGSATVGVSTAAGCAWTSTSPAAWVAVGAGSGAGSGTATYSVSPNTGAARTTTLTIAGRPYSVSQGAAVAPPPSAPTSPSPATGAAGVSLAPVLTWTASGATSYTVRFGTSSPPPDAATGLAAASYSPGTLVADRTHYWQVVAVSASGSTPGPVWSFRTVAAPPPPAGGPLPSPWQGLDIGSIGLTGSQSYSSGVFTLTGSGADVWGTTDAFRYVYRSLGSRTQIVARLTAVQCTNPTAKAGIMVRRSVSASSAHVALFARSNGSVELVTRASSGAQTTLVVGTTQAAPAWLRLVRNGSTVTASVSANGTTWRTVGSARLSNLSSGASVGLAVTSRDTTLRNTSTFDSVTVR